jgi:hypothetical protein
MTSLDFDVAFGLFNPQSGVGKTNEFPIDISSLIFKSTSNISTGIKFANPRLDIQLISNAGTYLKCKVDYIKAYIKENPSVSVEANFGGSSTVSEDINKPQMYTSVNHHYKQFNRNWGSTNLLFDLTKNYNRIEYKFTLSNNMDSVNAHPQSPCFLLSDTKIKTKAIATIPLYFEKGTSITYRDSIMDIGDNINKSLGKGNVDTAVFVLVVKNGIPMKFKFEIVDALDILGNQLPLSGLERTYTINSPEVNSKGLTTTITNTNISLKLGKSLLNDFKKIKKMRFKLSVDGKDINSAIQITKNNSIGVKAGIILKGNYTTNLDSIK